MSGSLSSLIELNDEDVLRIERVVKVLNGAQGSRRDLEGFRKEIVGRFAEVTRLKVDVKVFTTDEEGTFAFDIEIQERLEGRFDPEQFQYEVQQDVLEIEGGRTKSGLYVVQGRKDDKK